MESYVARQGAIWLFLQFSSFQILTEVNGSCFLHLADGRGWVFETKESHFVRIEQMIDRRFTFTFFALGEVSVGMWKSSFLLCMLRNMLINFRMVLHPTNHMQLQ